MEDGVFNPARLKLARERNGLTKQRLSELCDVSRRTITAWESGDVDAPPLGLIADVLRFPVSFFTADDPPLVPIESVSFRAMSTMTARQAQRVLAASALAVDLSEWIDNMYKTPKANLPDLSEHQDNSEPITWPAGIGKSVEHLIPAVAADSLRTIWSMGQLPARNLLTFLERKGIRIFSLPVDDREVDAFSFWQEDRPFIFLNTGKSAERLRFDLAHELCHLLIHRGIDTRSSRAYEQQAQEFAASFLVPADAVYSQVIGNPTLDDVFELRSYWRISAVAMVHRLFELSIVSEWNYRIWMIELSQRGYRKSEPGGMHPEQSRFLQELFQLSREDGWSAKRIAAELHIGESDLNAMVFGLALVNAP